MKIAIVYGNRKNGSTHNCVQIVKKAMESYGDVSFEEIWLSKELPDLCCGCFNCFIHGESNCPHSEKVSRIVNSIIDADGVILASPVYGLNVSGVMKNFIDHLCFMWMSHRPHNEVFSEIGFVISTTAGAGIRKTNKTMKSALDFMGFKRTYTFGATVAACSWEDIKESKKEKINKKLVRKAKRFYHVTANRKALRSRLFTKVVFKMMKGMTFGFDDGHTDKEYWRSMGWYDNVKPL